MSVIEAWFYFIYFAPFQTSIVISYIDIYIFKVLYRAKIFA